MVYPLPVIPTLLTVTAPVPVDESVKVFATGEPMTTLPYETLDGFQLKVGVEGLNVRVVVFDTPLEFAVSMTVFDELTAEAVAVNPALVAFAGTVTEEGTATDELVVASATLTPPLGAAVLKVTVQASVPAPVSEPVAQFRLLRTVVVASWMANVSETPAADAVRVTV